MVGGSNAPIAFSSALCSAFSTHFDVELIRSRLLLISGDLKGRERGWYTSFVGQTKGNDSVEKKRGRDMRSEGVDAYFGELEKLS